MAYGKLQRDTSSWTLRFLAALVSNVVLTSSVLDSVRGQL